MRLLIHRFPAVGGLLLFALLCAAMAGTQSRKGQAATILVTNTNDNGPGSLRQALADAADGNTIQFDPALNGQTINLTSVELLINKNITISGPGSDLLAVARLSVPEFIFRIFHITPNHTVAISGLTISGGNLPQGAPSLSGAGILNEQGTLTIENCTVSSNSAFNDGGGISNTGTLVVSHSAIISNFAGFFGGGISNSGTMTLMDSTVRFNATGADVVGTETGFGGGIYNTGTAVIVSSTIDNNVADANNHSSQGGGIYSLGFKSLAIISNSTISQNVAFIRGGAIYGGGEITNCTISGNIAEQGGGIYVTSGLQIGDSILNRGADGSNILNVGGIVTSKGYNVCSDSGGGFLTGPGDQINTVPMLGPLQNNGGPTFTHELLLGSPAINAGDPAFTPPPEFDQRGPGFPRVINSRIDIGSFEVQQPSTPSPTPTVTPSPTPTATATSSPTVTPTPSCVGNDQFCFDVGILMSDAPDPVEVGRDLTYSITVFGENVGAGWPVHMTDSLPAGVNLVSVSTSDGVCSGTTMISCDLVLPWELTARVTLVVTPTAPGTLSNTAVIDHTFGDVNPFDDSFTETTTVIPGPSPTPTPSPVAQALNLSTRLRVLTDANVGIGGFIISGSSQKHVILRGIGPSLAGQGVNPLPDPILELHGPSGFVTITNDNWTDTTPPLRCGKKYGLSPTNNLESCIEVTLDPAPYTAILRDRNSSVGIGLVEIYDVDAAVPSRLANISTRGFVATGSDIMIGGFIIGGDIGSDNVIVRGIGPSLTNLGVPNALADPRLELRDSSGTLLQANDNWKDDPTGSCPVILAGAGLAPSNTLESAFCATLAPGPYTALLAGVNNGTGIGLIEVYDLGLDSRTR